MFASNVGNNGEWMLCKYARLHHSLENGDTWIHHEAQDLQLHISATYHLVIKTSSVILESIPLLFSKFTLHGFCRGDSMLFIHKLNPKSRRFRVQFNSVRNRSSILQCQNCFSVLSQYVMMKCTDTESADDAIASSQQTVTRRLTGEVTAGDVIVALTSNTSNIQLPEAYQQQHEDIDGLKEIITLCLSDVTFPSFVGLVEKQIQEICNECQSDK